MVLLLGWCGDHAGFTTAPQYVPIMYCICPRAALCNEALNFSSFHVSCICEASSEFRNHGDVRTIAHYETLKPNDDD